MSVIAIGTDIVDITRIDNMPDKMKSKLAVRVLTERERAIFEARGSAASYLAKRWAAKEAASKALGYGIANGISFQHFEVTNNEAGKPELTLTGRAQAIAEEMGVTRIAISLSDEKQHALAFVVLS